MTFAPCSDDQWDHFLEAWRIFDTNSDGVVTAKDLQTVLRSFGYEHEEDDIESYLDQLPVCLERDRALDLPEFILWMKQLSSKIAKEEYDKAVAYEQELQEAIPKDNNMRTLLLKENLEVIRLNRLNLEALTGEEEMKINRELFELIDSENNGVLTYQDIQKLSNELHEPWQFPELDEMMYGMSEHGAQRRVNLEKFVSVLKEQLCWDEPDLLPCQEEVLKREEERRIAEEERAGKLKARKVIKRGRFGPAGLKAWYDPRRYGCAIM